MSVVNKSCYFAKKAYDKITTMIISGQVKSMREGNAMRIIAKVAGEVVRGATVLACTNIAILTGFVLLFGGKKEEEEPPTREATVPTEPVLPAAA